MKYKIVEEQKHQIKAEITSLEQEIKDLRDVIQNMEAKIKQETVCLMQYFYNIFITAFLLKF